MSEHKRSRSPSADLQQPEAKRSKLSDGDCQPLSISKEDLKHLLQVFPPERKIATQYILSLSDTDRQSYLKMVKNKVKKSTPAKPENHALKSI